jgi:hypothetical protein
VYGIADIMLLHYVEGMKLEWGVIDECINSKKTTVILLANSDQLIEEVSFHFLLLLNFHADSC